MEVAATVAEMRALRRAMAGDVGLVPTMGYLHEGHLSLVRTARRRDDHVVVSIFVNPTQFGPGEDFERYPRDPERDLALLRRERVDAVLLPSVEELYPEGDSTFVEVAGITEVLEGVHRPGHFRGVTTVVAKLFHIVQPRRAYFGRKDAQQLLVIRKLVRDLHFDVEVVAMPTVREPDGLAMSSRNAYLSPREREAALVLSRALRGAGELFAAGERDGERLRASMRDVIAQEPLAQVDYVSVADGETLRELDRLEGPALASLAVRIGAVRLIDNVTLE
ncbi:MAG: pantoate--beta-alanine ligase [Chloroflexi bacterium RBG_16_68_14]|nr:MAG: pantoate--beta-alanine ligase [Chloroflexi bacterium RBG_16_68_14]